MSKGRMTLMECSLESDGCERGLDRCCNQVLCRGTMLGKTYGPSARGTMPWRGEPMRIQNTSRLLVAVVAVLAVVRPVRRPEVVPPPILKVTRNSNPPVPDS